jgi:hypothetical protein
MILDVPALTGGAFLRFQGIFFGVSPGMAASFATKATALHLYSSSLNMKPLSEDKAFRYFFACSVKNVPEGLSGDLHMFRRMLMVESLQIRQPKGFEFVETQIEYLSLFEFSLFSFREKGGGGWKVADYPIFLWSWHEMSPIFLW